MLLMSGVLAPQRKLLAKCFTPCFTLQKYFSQFLVVFNITSEDEGTL